MDVSVGGMTTVGVSLGSGVSVGGTGVSVAVGWRVSLGSGVWVLVWVGVNVGVGVPDGMMEAVPVGIGVSVGVAVKVAVGVKVLWTR